MYNRKKVKERAKQMQRTHKSVSMGFPLLLGLSLGLMFIILGCIPKIGVLLTTIMMFVSSIVIPIVLSEIFLIIYRDEDISTKSAFQKTWKYMVSRTDCVKKYLWFVLWVFLWTFLLELSGTLLLSISFASDSIVLIVISLLLFIVGIIAVMIHLMLYSVYFYVVADNPEWTARECLNYSKKIMKGHRWDLFVTGLSFSGWLLLGLLTLNILTIVFVLPYMRTTFAGFYIEIKE